MSADAPRTGIAVLTPEWPVSRNVRAAFTLRTGGVSPPPFDALNVAAHVGDDAHAVMENRRLIRTALALPAEPVWMEQVHGVEVLDLDAAPAAPGDAGANADAAVTRLASRVCAVQVADCLPVLLAVRDGSAVAAAHAGWRGLAAGVLEATVEALATAPQRLIAWLGPAISQAHFEVGEDVRRAFLAHDADAVRAFAPNARGRWQCDLVSLAKSRLHALGVAAVFGGEWCTFADASRFFSFRRDGRCGRMAALIWREQ